MANPRSTDYLEVVGKSTDASLRSMYLHTNDSSTGSESHATRCWFSGALRRQLRSPRMFPRWLWSILI
jgi:hypothetical protein